MTSNCCEINFTSMLSNDNESEIIELNLHHAHKKLIESVSLSVGNEFLLAANFFLIATSPDGRTTIGLKSCSLTTTKKKQLTAMLGAIM